MTFRETLERHLLAIQERDLAALAETLPAHGITLITSDGRLVNEVSEFLEMHRGWFASKTWVLHTSLVSVTESAELGVAVLHLDYQDDPPGQAAVREESYLTLVFALHDGRWRMIHDQNTPVRHKAASGS
jgi:uncharacterized protein (TIGR02246 family)